MHRHVFIGQQMVELHPGQLSKVIRRKKWSWHRLCRQDPRFSSDCKTYQQDQKMDDAQAGVQQNEMLAQQAAELNNLQTVQVNEMQQLEFAQQKQKHHQARALSVYTDRCNRLVLQEQQQQPQQQPQRPDPSSPQAEQQQTTTPTAILETLPPEPEPKPEPPYDAHRVRSTATGEEAETPRRYPRELAADENGETTSAMTSAVIAAGKRAVAAEAQREEAIEHATAVEGMLAAAVERAAAAEAQLATTIARAAAAEARAETLVTRADAAQDQRACVVCFEQPKSHAPPCLHLCCCKGCGIGLVECPMSHRGSSRRLAPSLQVDLPFGGEGGDVNHACVTPRCSSNSGQATWHTRTREQNEPRAHWRWSRCQQAEKV